MTDINPEAIVRAVLWARALSHFTVDEVDMFWAKAAEFDAEQRDSEPECDCGAFRPDGPLAHADTCALYWYSASG